MMGKIKKIFVSISLLGLLFCTFIGTANAATHEVTVKSSKWEQLNYLGAVVGTTNYWRTIRYTSHCYLLNTNTKRVEKGLYVYKVTNYNYSYK
ncbi:hypothetical protein [Enterococcus casseliflavus]|uniref:hypothetical protein n=1 Tax=Enterococcus casseliflavus TaxID=37734 RepID=UPI0039A60AA9